MKNRRFVPILPVKLQIGDIVEAQISFMVIPLRGREFKITAVWHSLTLLDGQFAQVCLIFSKCNQLYAEILTKKATAAKMVKKIQAKAPVVLKCKVGYGVEEEAEARAMMIQMQLDSDTERTKEWLLEEINFECTST